MALKPQNRLHEIKKKQEESKTKRLHCRLYWGKDMTRS